MTDTVFMHTNTTEFACVSADLMEVEPDKAAISPKRSLPTSALGAADEAVGDGADRAARRAAAIVGRTSTRRCSRRAMRTAKTPRRSASICARSRASKLRRYSSITTERSACKPPFERPGERAARCATLGGGGHFFMASGLTFEGEFTAALAAVHAALKAQALVPARIR